MGHSRRRHNLAVSVVSKPKKFPGTKAERFTVSGIERQFVHACDTGLLSQKLFGF
jgi:hypothetical protein